MDEFDLKPCPFCGNEADIEYSDGKYGTFTFVKCSYCGSTGKTFKVMGETYPGRAEKRAAFAWNKRVSGE